MKKLKKLAALVLTGALALTMLAGCGGSSSGSGSNTDAVKLLNIMFQLNGSDIEVEEKADLTKQAENYVEWLSQAKEIPVSVADDKENAEYYETRRYDEYVATIREHRNTALYNSGVLVLDVGSYEYTDSENWATNDERIARNVANYILELQEGNDTYWVSADYGDGEDVDLTGITITGVGIAKASDVNNEVYASTCVKHCGKGISGTVHASSYTEDDDNYLAHTQKFNGWIVLVSFTR